jgi:hypothetical protein
LGVYAAPLPCGCADLLFAIAELLYFILIVILVYIGAIFLILHDISDACLAIARFYGDLFTKKGDRLAYFFYTTLLVSWIWTRLYVLPKCTIAQFYMNHDDTELW